MTSSPYFAVDHLTPQKRYDDDYIVNISSGAEFIVFNPEAFEKIAEQYLHLFKYGLKEKTRLTTCMALSYSALMAPSAFLRVARWFRFCAGQNIAHGLEPIIENKSQQKIAQLLGISRTTLAGTIRVLREHGAVDTRYRRIKINIEKLNDVINETTKDASCINLN